MSSSSRLTCSKDRWWTRKAQTLASRVKAGEFVWCPAGSRHVAWCPNGGRMIAIFQVPNKFFEKDGKVTDAGGKTWQSAWGHVLSN